MRATFASCALLLGAGAAPSNVAGADDRPDTPPLERVATDDLVEIDDDRQIRSFAVAHNPDRDEYLAVWRDVEAFVDAAVVGALLRADGSVVRGPFVIAAPGPDETALAPASVYEPQVVYNPSTLRYLVVLLRNSEDPATPASERRRAEILGRTLSSSGDLLGTEVALNPPLGAPGQDVCTPAYPDVVADPATGGFVLVYARTYASAVDGGDLCDGLDPAASVTVVQALSGALVRGTSVDFPEVNSAGPARPRIGRHPTDGSFLVTQPFEGIAETAPGNRDGLRVRVQRFAAGLAPLGSTSTVDVGPVEPTGTGPVDDARVVADPVTGSWMVLSTAAFFGPNWTNLLAADGSELRPGTRLDEGRPTSLAAVGDGSFVYATQDGAVVHVRADGTRIHPASVFPASILQNSAIAVAGGSTTGVAIPGLAVGLGPDGAAAVPLDVVAPGVLAVEPARLLDTRVGSDFATVDGLAAGGGTVGSGRTVTLEVAGRGGVPDDAEAVVVNVAAVGASGTGYVTGFPCDASRPTAATLNYNAGAAASSAGFVRLSSTGTLCLYVERATDLVLDVDGFVPAAASVEPVVPARLLETRSGVGATTVDGRSQGVGRAAAGSTTIVEVTGRGGVTADASAVIVDVAAIRPSTNAFLTVYPCDAPERPLAANLNARAGSIVNNLVAAKVSENGTVCVFSSAATDLVVDVTGFVPADGGLLTVVPSRLVETRSGTELTTVDGEAQGVGALDADSVTVVQVADRGGVAEDATGAMLNVASILAPGGGFMTLYPCDAAERPQAASLNFGTNSVVSNAVFVKLAADGTVCLFSTARSDVTVDVVGYVVDD